MLISEFWRCHLPQWAAPLALLLVAVPSAAATLSLEDALRLAARNAPGVAAADAKVQAARHAAVPAGELPDPRLAVGVENLPIEGPDRYRLTRDFMTMQRFAVMQDVPNRAKREARVAVAQARIERGEAESRVARLMVQRETALAWLRRYTIERQLERLHELAAENRLLETAVRAQLAGGRAMATDAVMPRQEAAMLAERQDELTAQREQAMASLARWIGEAASAPLAGVPPAWPLERAALLRRLHQHPELAAFQATERLLDAEVQEAEAMKKPDWGVELAYQRRGREFGDMVSLQFSVELPWFAGRRQDPQIAAKRAERAGVDAEREMARREHAEMLASDLAELDRLDRALARYRDTLLPLAQEKVDLALAAYQGGKGGLNEVLGARRERIEAQLKQIGLEGERWRMAARLHFAYGHIDDPAGDPGQSGNPPMKGTAR